MADSVPFEAWEVPELRLALPAVLQLALGSPSPVIGVSRRKLAQLHVDHGADAMYFGRLEEMLERYEYWGHSRSRPDAIEVYARLDGIWFTVVIYRPGPNTQLNSLGTMHRIDRRKVESRIRRYLQRRGEEE